MTGKVGSLALEPRFAGVEISNDPVSLVDSGVGFGELAFDLLGNLFGRLLQVMKFQLELFFSNFDIPMSNFAQKNLIGYLDNVFITLS